MPDGGDPAGGLRPRPSHTWTWRKDLGLDTICLAEFHFTPNRVISSPLMVGAAIAGRTKRITIGTSVLVLPLSNPLRVAEEGATLDHVSGGRFEFGVGRSGFQAAYQGYGIPYSESRDRFREALDVITMAWTNERFSYSGEYYSYENVCVVPKPVQSPHPPIRIAATTNETFPGERENGLPPPHWTADGGPARGDRASGGLQEGIQGSRPRSANGRLAAHPRVRGPRTAKPRSPSRRRASCGSFAGFSDGWWRMSRPALERQREMRGERAASIASMNWEDVQREKVAVGTPEMVVEQLSKLKEALHLTEVVAEFNAGELIPPEHIERSLRLFCEKVIPALR